MRATIRVVYFDRLQLLEVSLRELFCDERERAWDLGWEEGRHATSWRMLKISAALGG